MRTIVSGVFSSGESIADANGWHSSGLPRSSISISEKLPILSNGAAYDYEGSTQKDLDLPLFIPQLHVQFMISANHPILKNPKG